VFVYVEMFGYARVLRDDLRRRWSRGEYRVRAARLSYAEHPRCARGSKWRSLDGALGHAPQRVHAFNGRFEESRIAVFDRSWPGRAAGGRWRRSVGHRLVATHCSRLRLAAVGLHEVFGF